jgi:hypothetical protein
MDINSTFIFSDVVYMEDFFPQNPKKIEQNLRFHILSPEEKVCWNEPAIRTACKVHFSLSRNLYLYSYNPSSGKLIKKIAARALILPCSIFEFTIKIFNDVSMLITYSIKQITYNSTSTITDPELKYMHSYETLRKDPLCLSFAESLRSKLTFFLILFSNDLVFPTGFKVHNKTLGRDEYMIDLEKIEVLKKYYGWEDATDQEIQTLLEQLLIKARTVIEYEIKDGKLDWNYIKFSNEIFPIEKHINFLIDKGLLKDESQWSLYH